MLNFFSKIRKKLAAENKVMAYLRYAIGEILLVVIGILIALQINNWNESRKKENEFRFSLKQLHEAISIDQALMTSLTDIYTFQLKMIDSLLNGAKNIPVKAGHYKVFVDLNEQTYKFTPLKDWNNLLV